MLDVVVFVLGAWGDRLCNKYYLRTESIDESLQTTP